MSNSKPDKGGAPQAGVVGRRTLFAGAGAVGALGVLAAASKLPVTPQAAVQTSELATSKSSGYQLTDHVKQYYATARI